MKRSWKERLVEDAKMVDVALMFVFYPPALFSLLNAFSLALMSSLIFKTPCNERGFLLLQLYP